MFVILFVLSDSESAFFNAFICVISRLLFEELSLRIIILFFVNYLLSNKELMSHQLNTIYSPEINLKLRDIKITVAGS